MSTLPSGIYRVELFMAKCYGCGHEETFTRTGGRPLIPEGWVDATHSWASTYGMQDRHEYFCRLCSFHGRHQEWLDSFKE